MKTTILQFSLFASSALCMATPPLPHPSVLESVCAGLSLSSRDAIGPSSVHVSGPPVTPTPVFSTLPDSSSPTSPAGPAIATVITHTLTLTLTAAPGVDVDTFASEVPPAPVPTHVVQVGPRGALVFEPPEVSASRGDVIRFTFVSGNHTATQSSLEQPCVANGFDTGFISVSDGMPRHVDYIVDADQAWFHCRQADHCARGMVFAVNPGAQPSQVITASARQMY